MSRDAKLVYNIVETRLWVLDYILSFYFAYITFFEKPFWCIKKSALVSDDCREDIYGNDYNLWTPLDIIKYNTFIPTTLIMIYFICKKYVIYVNIESERRIYKSARFNRLIVLTFLGLTHLLFYFFAKDGIFNINICSLIKVIFLMIQM